METSLFGSDEATTESFFDNWDNFHGTYQIEFKMEQKGEFALVSGESVKGSQSLFETMA